MKQKNIESIAIQKDIDDWLLWNDRASTDCVIDILRRAIPRMPAIQQLLVVHEWTRCVTTSKTPLTLYYLPMVMNSFDSGSFSGWSHSSRPTELYDEFQVEWQKVVHEIHIDDEDSMSQCIEPLKLEDSIKKISVPKIEMVWGWRPTKLDDEMIHRIYGTNGNWHD
ncbi:hypothetical protein B0O99DRAFT_685050 [Bisporella sp. PMI_857]|nr:hypothetical protein B0O99DRAFT_685050 [Bisporella sp. PMI_857]